MKNVALAIVCLALLWGVQEGSGLRLRGGPGGAADGVRGGPGGAADEVSREDEKVEEAIKDEGVKAPENEDKNKPSKGVDVKPHNFEKSTGAPPKFILVLGGPPGAGKGTVAEVLKNEEPSTLHLSAGDLLRAKVTAGGEEGEKLREIMKSGKLVPDELTFGLIKEQIQKANGRPVLLDGFPRSAGQASMMLDFLKESEWLKLLKVVNIDLAEEAVVQRLSGRKYHKASGRTYGPDAEVDSVTGEPLDVREDDNPDTIRARLQTYAENRDQLAKVFEGGNVAVRKVEGDRPQGEVAKAVAALLNV